MQRRHGSQSVRPGGPAARHSSSRRQGLGVHDGERRDRTGEDDVEPAQAGALVGLGGDDGGGLDDDDPVELQALGRRWPGTTSTWWSTSPWSGAEHAVLDPLSRSAFDTARRVRRRR